MKHYLNIIQRNRKQLAAILIILAFSYNLFLLVGNKLVNVKDYRIQSFQINSSWLNGKDRFSCNQSESNVEDSLNLVGKRLLNYASTFFKDQIYPGAQTYIHYTIVQLGLKSLADVTPLRPEYGIVVNDVTAFKYPIEIAKCRKETNANRTLFIGIISAPNYFDKRQLLRETWLRHVNDPHYHRGLIDVVGFGFILGQTSNATIQSQIEEESKKHGDILQVEMDDSYRNLTRKSVAFLNWVNSNCPHVDFALKIDDDCYSNVHNLANILAGLSPSEISVYGNLLANFKVIRAADCIFFQMFNLPQVFIII